MKKTIEKICDSYNRIRAPFNIGAGMVMGAILPIVFLRYYGCSVHSNNFIEEALKWVGSAVAGAPLSYFGAILGGSVGAAELIHVKLRNYERETKKKQNTQIERNL